MPNSIQYTRQKTTGTLSIAEPLDITNANDVLETVRRAANDARASEVTVTVPTVERFDTSIFQLLIALKAYVEDSGRTFSVDQGSSERFLNFCKTGGLQ